MICPKCGAEYQPGFTRCADCRVDLVDPAAVSATAASMRDAAAADEAPLPTAVPRAGETPGRQPVLGRLLVAVVACFVVMRVVGAVAFGLLTPDQSANYYVVNAAIQLGPAAVEAVAVVLALRGSGGRLAWSVLLACGFALLAVHSYYMLTVGGFGLGVLEGLALVALALVQLPRRPALPAEVGDAGGQGVVHS